MDCTFSKNDTNIVKGIAILAMLFHHTYPNNPGIPIYIWLMKRMYGYYLLRQEKYVLLCLQC